LVRKTENAEMIKKKLGESVNYFNLLSGKVERNDFAEFSKERENQRRIGRRRRIGDRSERGINRESAARELRERRRKNGA